MKNYSLTLKSKYNITYRNEMAANSLDIDMNEKSIHHLSIDAEIESPFNIGLIVGNSGSGKTTLAKKIYGDNCFEIDLDQEKSLMEHFPKEMEYKDIVHALTSIGLNSVPCWIRPLKTLSNGQKARAEAVLKMCEKGQKEKVIDEFTSVVDRTVAKIMSHSIMKYARKMNKKNSFMFLSL